MEGRMPKHPMVCSPQTLWCTWVTIAEWFSSLLRFSIFQKRKHRTKNGLVWNGSWMSISSDTASGARRIITLDHCSIEWNKILSGRRYLTGRNRYRTYCTRHTRCKTHPCLCTYPPHKVKHEKRVAKSSRLACAALQTHFAVLFSAFRVIHKSRTLCACYHLHVYHLISPFIDNFGR